MTSIFFLVFFFFFATVIFGLRLFSLDFYFLSSIVLALNPLVSLGMYYAIYLLASEVFALGLFFISFLAILAPP